MSKTHFPRAGGNQWVQSFYEEPGSPILVGRTTGNVFYVNATGGSDTDGYGYSPEAPFASITYAITKCTANNGDRIYALPGHVETIASAAATMTFSGKAGVAVIGLGIGTNRPKITFTGTDAIITMAAANCILSNVWLDAGIDEVVTAITVTAANCLVDRVDVVEHAAQQFIQFLLTTSAGTDLVIQNCTHHQSTASASNAKWIQLVAADRAKVLGNRIFITTTSNSGSNVIAVSTAAVNILIADNTIVQLGGTATIPITLVSGTSGFVARNTVASAKSAIAGSIACASCYASNNYAGHVVNTSGLLEPVVDA